MHKAKSLHHSYELLPKRGKRETPAKDTAWKNSYFNPKKRRMLDFSEGTMPPPPNQMTGHPHRDRKKGEQEEPRSLKKTSHFYGGRSRRTSETHNAMLVPRLDKEGCIADITAPRGAKGIEKNKCPEGSRALVCEEREE